MKPKRAIHKVLCKFGFHDPRVTGHADAKEGTEYYYDCAWCDDDGFWDYAMPDRAYIEIENTMKLLDYIEKNKGIKTSEIINRFQKADHWKILEALDQLKKWKLVK